MTGYFTIGEFADRAGVSVRTIRYYDQIGLLKPSAYAESGRRLYSDPDYTRLQQILTLKLIGLSLEAIKHLLTTDTAQLQRLLQQQKRVLQAQAQQLTQVIQAIEHAQSTIHTTQTVDLQSVIDIIKAVNMKQQTNWLDQFLTEAEQTQLAQVGAGQTLAQQKATAEAWRTLFAAVQANLDKDIHDPAVQQLVEEWDRLTQQAAGDSTFTAPITAAYADLTHVPDLEHAPPAVRDWAQSLQSAAAFIQRARAAS